MASPTEPSNHGSSDFDDDATTIIEKDVTSQSSVPTEIGSGQVSDSDLKMRHVHSHPSMSQTPPSGTRSLGSIPISSAAPATQMTPFAALFPTYSSRIVSTGRASNPTILSSHSSLGGRNSSTQLRSSPDDRSPGATMQQRQASPAQDDNEEEEDGAHDTITSLAGAKMLQRYRKAMSGSRKGSASSLDKHRLEDLFLIEEDVKDVDEDLQVTDEELEESSEVIFVPPDGGYGWFVALGAFIALFWTAGMIKSYGVIFDMILKTFPKSSVALAAWIPASMTTLALALAPVASALCQRYNCRTVCFMGSILCAIGISLSSLVNNVESLFFTFGVLTGIGVGLSTTPGVILVARYFEKRRGIANAFCLSGTAAGSLCLPFLMEGLAHQYGFRGTMLILGGCMLHISISAALYRPLDVHMLIISRAKGSPSRSSIPDQQQPIQVVVKDPDFKSLHLHHLQHQHSHNHHHHHVNPDPQEVVARLHSRLNSIEDNQNGGDSSSYSRQVSGDDSLSVHSQEQQHTPSSSSFGYRHSFGSLPCSLPAQYEQQQQFNQFNLQTPTNSSLASREDLQCSWPEAGRFDVTATPNHTPYDPSTTSENVSTAKPMSLRELYKHQLGSQLSFYKSMLLGSGAPPVDRRHSTKTRAPRMSTVPSYSSVTHHYHKNPHQHHHAAAPKSHQEPSTIRFDVDKVETKRDKWKRRASLMFSIEDMTTDSTSVLKDARHPSVSTITQVGTQGPVGRMVHLERSVSSAADNGSTRGKFHSSTARKRRPRYLSEGHPDSDVGSPMLDHRKGSRFTLVSPSTLNSSEYLSVGVAGAPTPIQEESEDTGSPAKEIKVQKPVGLLNSIWASINKYLDLKLVKEPLFLIMMLSVMCMSVGVPHVLFFLPSYANSLGIGADPAVLLSVTSIADLLGRIVFGIILDADWFPKHYAYAAVIMLAGLSVVALPLAPSYFFLALAMAGYGLGSGSWFLMVPLLLAEFLGVEKIGSSYGLVRLFQAVSNLGGPLIAGLVWDRTGSFAAAFLLMGAVMLVGTVIVLFKPLADKRSDDDGDEDDEI